MKKHNTSRIPISFIFCFVLAVISFLTVYSLPACISSWLWASVFCLIKISYQVVNEAIYELLSFWVNRPLIVIGKRQIHIWVSVQLAVCLQRQLAQVTNGSLSTAAMHCALVITSFELLPQPSTLQPCLKAGSFSLFLIFLL